MKNQDDLISFCSFENEILIMDGNTGKDIAMSFAKATNLCQEILAHIGIPFGLLEYIQQSGRLDPEAMARARVVIEKFMEDEHHED